MSKTELRDSAIDLARDKNEKYTEVEVKLIYWEILRKKRLINKNK